MTAQIIAFDAYRKQRRQQQQEGARILDGIRGIRDTAANEFAALFLAIEAAGRAPTEAESRRLDRLAQIVNRFEAASQRIAGA